MKFCPSVHPCHYKANPKGRLVTHLNLYIWKRSFNVQSANISSVPKLLFPSIINLYIWANNSNVWLVIISSLRRVAWWLIINVYIWVKSFNVQSMNIRQMSKSFAAEICTWGPNFQCAECDYQATQKGNLVPYKKIHIFRP